MVNQFSNKRRAAIEFLKDDKKALLLTPRDSESFKEIMYETCKNWNVSKRSAIEYMEIAGAWYKKDEEERLKQIEALKKERIDIDEVLNEQVSEGS